MQQTADGGYIMAGYTEQSDYPHRDFYLVYYNPVEILASGRSVSGSVAEGDWVYYKIGASVSNTQVKVELTNLSADVNLYVNEGSLPTLTAYDCRPYEGGTTAETCTLSNSGATTWFIGVYGYKASSYTIKATLIGPAPGISRTPSSLIVSCTQGTNAASQSLQVSNSGGGTLSYSISVDAS